MGYTHYWTRPRIIHPTLFLSIGHDLLKLVPTLESLGVPLANPFGREEPQIGPESIGFNGVQCCGHAKNPNVVLPWPAKQAKGIGGNEGLAGTLPYRTCDGDCSYESLWFERCISRGEPADKVESFCKTAFRPYDLAVNAILVIAKHHLGDDLTVETDGEQCQWSESFELCQDELGYGSEFFIDGTGPRVLRTRACA